MTDRKCTEIGFVLESSPSAISIELLSQQVFEENSSACQVGSLLKVNAGNLIYTIVMVRDLKAACRNTTDDTFSFMVTAQPVGYIDVDGDFVRGNASLPVPLEKVYTIESDLLNKVYSPHSTMPFELGVLSQNRNVKLFANGDRLFGKHVAVVGSSGSGKSCTVARILQSAVGISKGKNIYSNYQRNSHLILFDIHNEYRSAFEMDRKEDFRLTLLDVDNLCLPYWLLNAQELESMFLDGGEGNNHNQLSQFRHAVTLNKQRHNRGVNGVSYDTPVYFSIAEVCNYLDNLNNEVIGKTKDDENRPKLENGTLVSVREDDYFDTALSFIVQSGAKDSKATNGPFNGDFDRLIMRLRSKLRDSRLGFLLNPKKADGSVFDSSDFSFILQQFIGYRDKANVTIVDLSGIPSDVLNIVVSLMCRLTFDFCYQYTRWRTTQGLDNEIPLMIVCEEAHNYAPRIASALHSSSKASLERIAKEGRKYGLTLMVVSQRPSDVSETIFAQCSNFINLRLTNSTDQGYVKSLLPDSGLTDLLPHLSEGEFLVVGDAVVVPSVARSLMPTPEPSSKSIPYLKEWSEPWKQVDFAQVVSRWRKEG